MKEIIYLVTWLVSMNVVDHRRLDCTEYNPILGRIEYEICATTTEIRYRTVERHMDSIIIGGPNELKGLMDKIKTYQEEGKIKNVNIDTLGLHTYLEYKKEQWISDIEKKYFLVPKTNMQNNY